MADNWQNVPVAGQEMRAYITGVSDHALPGVLVCMHAPGVDEFMTTMCDRLAESGFAAICPDLYYRQDDPMTDTMAAMSRLRDDEVLVDLAAATAALRAAPGVNGDRFGVIGFCMGGRLSYLQAASDPELKASVVFYGGNILIPWGDGPSPFEQTDNIQAPMLGLFGGSDQNPSPADVAKLDAELTVRRKPHEFHSYDGAGHAFLNFVRPAAYREAAAQDAWQKCIGWLENHL